jgi:hypothetical protein
VYTALRGVFFCLLAWLVFHNLPPSLYLSL